MKHILSLNLSLICWLSYSQNFQINKIVADKNTKSPLENVIISNESDNSTTNADGKFVFASDKNEININLLGYNSIKTTFDELIRSKDTIFMDIKTIQLQEVFVDNAGSYMKKVYNKIKENSLQNYTVNFFLRNVLKKDNINIVLQDVYARQNKNANQKKKICIEILNMRKISIFEKKDNVNFKFPDFNEFDNVTAPLLDKCSFTEIPFNDNNFKKILFEINEKNDWGQIWKGYFIINRNDYAIVEYSLTAISDAEKVPYKKLSSSKGQYRTAKWNRFIKFSKDAATNKYYPSNSKLETKVEVNSEAEKKFYYDLNMDFFVTSSPTNEQLKSNFSSDKDIFKAKFPYSEDFWKKQNQLPLTKELELFLKSVAQKKDKTKEYEIIGNF